MDLGERKKNKIAMLIDGDNAQAKLIEKMLLEVAKYGAITIRRIYGDWTSSQMNSWKSVTNNHSIQPVQQFSYTTGKNATDSALIIDAMDILHSDIVEGFCIVSSDSDYTRLATRIREAGIFVMGIGETKTPKAFVNACNVFIYTENLIGKAKKPSTAMVKKHEKRKAPVTVQTPQEDEYDDEDDRPNPVPLLIEAYETSQQDDEWVKLSAIGVQLSRIDPGFDVRTYGFSQLSELIKAYSHRFELSYPDPKNRSSAIVRIKERYD